MACINTKLEKSSSWANLCTTRTDYACGRIGPYTILALLMIAYSTWFLTRRRTRQQFQR